jgi:N4-gp56 family major capsid protein
MSTSQGNYGAVTFRTANSGATGVKLAARLLFDAKKRMMLMRWATQEDLPQNAGQTIQWRRYHNIDTGLNPILGDQNPSASKISWTDFTSTLYRYGGVADIPEHMQILHEDDLVKVGSDLLSYDLYRKLETLAYNTVKTCTNAIWAGGVANIGSVVNVMTESDLEYAISILEENNAQEITELVTSSPDYLTYPIQPSFIAYCHSNVAPVVRNMNSFVGIEHYAGQTALLPGEIGTVMNKIRVVCSNIALPLESQGGNPVTNHIRGKSGAAHVYPFIIFAKDAFAVSKLSGQSSTKVMIKPPAANGDSFDKLGLQGHIGYKTWFGSTILQNDYMVRVMTGVPAYATAQETADGPAF